MPPASRMPSRTRLASSRCDRLQGARSEPDWAMPMSGLPDWSSSRVRPQLRYRSMYSAVMSGSSGIVEPELRAEPDGGPAGVIVRHRADSSGYPWRDSATSMGGYRMSEPRGVARACRLDRSSRRSWLLTVAIKAMYRSHSRAGPPGPRGTTRTPTMHAHDTTHQPTMDAQIRMWLRLEGLAALIAGAVDLLPARRRLDLVPAGTPGRGHLDGRLSPGTGDGRLRIQPVPQLGHRPGGAGRRSRRPACPLLAMVGAVLVAHVGMDRAARATG